MYLTTSSAGTRQLPMIALRLLFLITPAYTQDINIGDGGSGTGSCVPRGGGIGECRELFSCPAIVKTFRRVRPVICGFRGNAPIVCCPKPLDSRVSPPEPTTTTMTLTSAPPRINSECGRRNGRTETPISGGVVGGVEATPNSWPWMAAIGRFDTRGRVTWFCDGTLINRRYILTAGHCIAFSQVDVVRLGDHNLLQQDAVSFDARVASRIFHPQYHPPAVLNDLALLRLVSPVTITKKISPVCLPWVEKEAPDLEGRKLTLTGWGATSFGGPMSDVLREVVVTVFPNNRCDASYRNLRDYRLRFPGGIGDHYLCAGDRRGGKDACQGDSGGPLVYNVFGKYVVGGVVSTGHGCGQATYPGIYSEVGRHLQWIKQVAFSESF